MEQEYRTFKVVLNVEVKQPDTPYPAGGDYTQRKLIDGIVHSLVHMWLPDARVTLDKVVEKTRGESEQ